MSESMDNTQSKHINDSILYELLVYSEWKQAEQIRTDTSFIAPKTTFLNKILKLINPRVTVPELINEQIGCTLSWQFCIGENGKVIALLQDSSLEIRSSKDEYSSVIGKATVPIDNWPQWRRMAWTPDCSFLAVASSNGIVNFYDLLGCKLFSIPPECSATPGCKEIQHAISGLIFLQNRIQEYKWSAEVLIIDFGGNLRSYLLSPSDGYKLNHKFSFKSYYKNGISAVALHPSNTFLVISGYGNKEFGSKSLLDNGSRSGLSCWRILNDSPYYKLNEIKQETTNASDSQWLSQAAKVSGIVYKLSISTSGNLLACLHNCGTISIWKIPSLSLINIWKIIDQPDYNIPNPLLEDKKIYKGMNLKKMSSDAPIDINWWNDDAIILSRYSGAISVNSVKDLKNLLGNTPEFLSGQPQISSVLFNKGFIMLECESIISRPKKPFQDSNDQLFDSSIDEEDSFDDVEEPKFFLDYLIEMVKYSLYIVTDIDKFRPAIQLPKSVTRTYRLLCLKSSTPEELFSRKIDAEDYNEALNLAQKYNLDTDLVYKRQWQNSKVSKQSINDYLSKIKVRWWVLQQCVERLCDSVESSRELLEFGLSITNIKTFINKEENNIEYIHESDGTDSDKVDENELIQNFDIIEVDNAQKELLRYRILILKYLDRLFLYEKMLDDQFNFESSTFNEFRTSSVLYSALQLARKGFCGSLKLLFTYHLDELEDHIFPLLSNLPETMDVLDFTGLLPFCNTNGCPIKFEAKEIRIIDWCESERLQPLHKLFVNTELNSSDWLYANSMNLSNYRGTLDSTKMSQWYMWRAREIEQRTGIVDNALNLINIAIDKNVQKLDDLQFDLKTLDCLIYEVGVDNVSLSDLEQCTKLQRGMWLMNKLNDETFIDNLTNFYITYVHKTNDDELKMNYLKEFIIHLSETDLKWAFLYFEHLKKSSQPNGFVTKLSLSLEDKVNLATKCIYKNKGDSIEQIELSGLILECLPELPEEHPMSNFLANLEGELQCSKLLHMRHIPLTPKELHESKNNNARALELLEQLSRSVLKFHSSDIEWNDLLNDLIYMQETIFTCIDIEKVFEIYVRTLLLCGSKSDIESAADVIHCSANSTDNQNTKISYDVSVKLVLEAAREYFDSSRSLDDKNMDLSKTCLLLITDENEEIQIELDLIAAVKILHNFNVPILPIQVRLCSNRLNLIESCLNSVENKSRSIKYPQYIVHNYSVEAEVMELANRLRIFGDDMKKREGAVLEMLTKDALQKCNWSLCWSYCQKLINGEHGAHWRVITELARQGNSLLTSIRTEALDFSLLYCDNDAIEELLSIRNEIEIKELKMELDLLTGDNENITSEASPVESTPEIVAESPVVTPNDELFDPFSASLSTVKELPGSITKVMKMLNPKDILKESTFNLMSHIIENDFLKRRTNQENSIARNTFDEESYPCFYAGLHKHCVLSNFYTSYDRFSEVDIDCKQVQICRILLKLVVLENQFKCSSIPDMREVVIQYATYVLPEDITLGLAILLSLKNPIDAKTVIDTFPVTLASLKTAIYYLSLQIIFSDQENNFNMDLFMEDPDKLLQLALQNKSDSDMYLLLNEYLTKLEDFNQANELQILGCGVDTQRFANDEQYRTDSILGLAMTPDLDRYNFALKLGIRYKLNMPSIAFEHVSSLLQSSEVQPKFLSERLEDKELLSLLKEQPEITCERLLKEVFPTLDGTQHDVLIVYFTLTDKINPDYVSHGLLSKEHIKLLKKIKSACPVLDYTILLIPPENFVSQITSNLNQDELPILCKFLKSLPTQLSAKCQYTQSLLYKEWCKKHLSDIPINSPAKEYSKCWNKIYPVFSKINAEDFKMFVYHITLNPKYINRINIEIRLSLLKEAIAYCNERSKQDRIEGWSFTHSEFTTWEALLQTLRSASWQKLFSYGEDIEYIIKIVQTSCTDKNLLLSAYIELLKINAIPLEEIIVAMKEISGTPTIMSVLNHLISSCSKDLSSKNNLEDLTKVTSRLESFLSSNKPVDIKSEADFASGDWDNEWNIDDAIDNNEAEVNIMSETERKELADILLPLCGDSRIPSSLRLRFMKIIQEINDSSDNEVSSVMLYQHTQATISSTWSVEQGDVLSSVDLTNEQERFKVFQQFLDKVTEWKHVDGLLELLSYWPNFSIEHFADINSPWCELLKTVLSLKEVGDIENLNTILMKISEKSELSESTIETLHKDYANSIPDRLAILFNLIFYKNTDSTNYLKLHAIELINKIQEPLEDTILKLIITKRLVPDVVQSKSYKSLLELSLMSDETDSQNIVKDLFDSKLVAEAGSFGLSTLGTPASLRSFSAAIQWAKRLYTEEEE